jgi:hypothetical protein
VLIALVCNSTQNNWEKILKHRVICGFGGEFAGCRALCAHHGAKTHVSSWGQKGDVDKYQSFVWFQPGAMAPPTDRANGNGVCQAIDKVLVATLISFPCCFSYGAYGHVGKADVK